MTAPDKPEGLIAGGEQVRSEASHNTPPAEEDRGEPDDSWKEALEGDLFGLVGSAALAAGVTVTVEQSLAIAHAVMRYMLADESLPLLSSPRVEEKMREALEWYGEQARLCRLIHSEGDSGRHALADDGGKRALAALPPRSE